MKRFINAFLPFAVLLLFATPHISAENWAFIFAGDNYDTEVDFQKDAQICIQAMKEIAPFSEFVDSFRYEFFLIEDTICKVKKKDLIYPKLVCDTTINEYLRKYNYARFKLVVLSNRVFISWSNIDSVSPSAIFLSTRGKKEEEMKGEFMHELGHSFGLRDEYAPIPVREGSLAKTPGPNCAPSIEVAKTLWGDLAGQGNPVVGYYYGCAGNKKFVKPTQNSLMGTPGFYPGGYGLVSERYLRKILSRTPK